MAGKNMFRTFFVAAIVGAALAGCSAEKPKAAVPTSSPTRPLASQSSAEQALHANKEVQDRAANDPRYRGRLVTQTLLEESTARNWKPPTGNKPVFTTNWVRHGEPQWKIHLAPFMGKPNIQALEIGSFEGRSAIWFVQNVLTHPTSQITCVDLFGERLDAFFDHNINVTGVADKVRKLKGRSQHVLRTLPYEETFDFVYVDGCHLANCALADMVLSFDLIKVGGLMIVDDYGWSGPEHDRPKIAVDAFLHIYQPHLEVVHKGYQVIVRKTSSAF
jgi:predicted O-methyltransferase YrrM